MCDAISTEVQKIAIAEEFFEALCPSERARQYELWTAKALEQRKVNEVISKGGDDGLAPSDETRLADAVAMQALAVTMLGG